MATNKEGRAVAFLSSTKNIAGCVLGLGGPALAVAGVVNPPVGLALIPPLYVAGALIAPARRKLNLTAGADPEDVRRSLATLEKRIRGRVPDQVQVRVTTISTLILDALPKAESLGATSQDLFVLTRTATDYLPTSLQAYTDLPRTYADHQVISNGMTALDLVCEQLDLLAAKMKEVADAIHKSDAEKLVANGQFLADKFGRKNSLDLGGSS